MALTNPALLINEYIAEALVSSGSTVKDYFGVPMFFLPSAPTSISDLYEGFPTAVEGQPFAVYERMFKMRRAPFPHCKCEQLLYYLYKNGSKTDGENAAILFETTQMIYNLMDRGDESAEEINAWIAANLDANGFYRVKDESGTPIGPEFNPVYFHSTKVFQLEETRDIIDFATAQTYFGNKIIVDYEYHNNNRYEGVVGNYNAGEPVFKDGSFNLK